MIDVICKDQAAWRELLGKIREQQRFYSTDDLDASLVDSNGMPILIQLGENPVFRFHIYPPARTGDWATALLTKAPGIA